MNLKNILIAVLAIIFTVQVHAANNILINEYIKAGVNELTGTFGSGRRTPPGLMFDGTGTGTFNDAFDYLTPGFAFDGFAVRLEDGSGGLVANYANNNETLFPSNIPGGWIGVPDNTQAIWEGTVPEFTLRNSYSLLPGQQYIDITTQITAQTHIAELYFGRFVDPDAKATILDSSVTDNALGYGVISGQNIVFSEAIDSRYALGLYTAQTTGTYGAGLSSLLWSTNPIDYLNNTSGNITTQADDAIGLGFMVPNLNIGDIVIFKYAYIFGTSAFNAASSAINGGAGGGVPGQTPSGQPLVDVGSATDAANGILPPTVVSTTTSTITVSDITTTNTLLPVVTGSIARHATNENDGVQTVTRETSTSVTTPTIRTLVTLDRTVSTFSDGSVTTTDSPTTTTLTLGNDIDLSVVNDTFSGRIDQYKHLQEINTGINRMLNNDRFRKRVVETQYGRVWLTYNFLDSDTSNGYDAASNHYGVGYERDITDNWMLGIQYNSIITNMNGVDSKTHQNKNHLGVYNSWFVKDWIIKSDLGLAHNDLHSNRNVQGLFFNANETDGFDWWMYNKVFAPNFKGFRPYVGAAFGRDYRSSYVETGSIQTARTVVSDNDDANYAETGVNYEKKFNKLTLSSDVSVTSDNYQTYKATATYDVTARSELMLEVGRQNHSDLSTNIIGVSYNLQF